MEKIDRREFLKLAGFGGVVFASGVSNWSEAASKPQKDFYFVQLSDTHWGFNGPKVNPDATGTLQKAIAAVNALDVQPDFVIFTGDLTHTTDDPKERRRRLAEFAEITSGLKVKHVRYIPGEHDASLDRGEAYQEAFGKPYYAFDHKGIHFVALDNVSDPTGALGEGQLKWLATDLKSLPSVKTPVVVFAHRPLFDLYPEWDWATRDGAQAIEILKPYRNVTVFYGHIHQENHHMTDHIAHHSAKSLIFPLPAPGSQPKRAPIPWDPDQPYNGLGFRDVETRPSKPDYIISELPVVRAQS